MCSGSYVLWRHGGTIVAQPCCWGERRWLGAVLCFTESRVTVCRDPGYSFKSPYALEGGKETGVWLLLQHGTSPKHMPITLVSNQRFTEVPAHAL